MALDELKKIRATRRRLLRLELRDFDTRLRVDMPKLLKAAEFQGIAKERKALLDQLENLETRYLIRKAESWGIEVPYKADWYQRDIDDSGGVELVTFSDRLNTLGKAVITRQIREARRASMKWWADILVPLIALAVAFLALFKDIIVAYIQANAPEP